MLVVAPLKLELSSDAMQMQPMLVAGGWMLPAGPLKLELSLLPYNVMTMLVTPLYIYYLPQPTHSPLSPTLAMAHHTTVPHCLHTLSSPANGHDPVPHFFVSLFFFLDSHATNTPLYLSVSVQHDLDPHHDRPLSTTEQNGPDSHHYIYIYLPQPTHSERVQTLSKQIRNYCQCH